MRSLMSVVVLLLLSAPAFAAQIPEPDVLGLFGIGAVALLVTKRRKK